MPTIDGISQKMGNVSYFNNFLLFAKDVLTFQGEMAFDFSKVHEEVADTITQNRYALIILPRGHLKSSLIKCYALWRLYKHPKYEICLVSATLDQSMKSLAWIQKAIKTTPWLKHLVPSSEDVWNKSQLETSNGSTCYIRPFNASARGIHPNEILYDDILRESDISMDDIKDVFWSVFFPMGQTHGCKHIIVGTPVHADDLFVEIEEKMRRGSEWVVLKRQAIVEDEIGKQKPLWSARYSLDELETIKKDMGTYKFNREFLCDCLAEGSGFFPREMILNTLEEKFTFNHNTQGTVYLAADFAMSESASGDYNCFTVVESIQGILMRKMSFNGKEMGLPVENPVIVKYIDHYKGATGQVRRLKELWDIYRPQKIILDVSNFGMRFAQELRDLDIWVDAQDFRPANRANLLTNLRRLFESDDVMQKPPRLILPFSEADFTKERVSILTKELSGFRETKTPGGFTTIASNLKHDDTVMSLALACKDIGIMRGVADNIISPIEEVKINYLENQKNMDFDQQFQYENDKEFHINSKHEWRPSL